MPVDVGDGVEVAVELVVLGDRPVEAGDELGDLDAVIEVPAPMRRS